jgi:argininosuccinate lyase
MSKLWQKETKTERSVEKFTVGNDRELDHQLAAFDVLGSLAHTRMLQSIGLMDSRDLEQVQAVLNKYFKKFRKVNLPLKMTWKMCIHRSKYYLPEGLVMQVKKFTVDGLEMIRFW